MTPAAQERSDRITQQRTHDYIGSAWLVDHGGAEVIVILPEALQSFGERAGAEIRAATDDDTSWLASRV